MADPTNNEKSRGLHPEPTKARVLVSSAPPHERPHWQSTATGIILGFCIQGMILFIALYVAYFPDQSQAVMPSFFHNQSKICNYVVAAGSDLRIILVGLILCCAAYFSIRTWLFRHKTHPRISFRNTFTVLAFLVYTPICIEFGLLAIMASPEDSDKSMQNTADEWDPVRCQPYDLVFMHSLYARGTHIVSH